MVNTKTKLFVLDTNVLLHDPSCLYRFEEHDIYLPMVTLEELDNIKKGSSEVARNARQTSRFIEEIIADTETNLDQGCLLDKFSKNSGRLFLQTQPIDYNLPMLAGIKADNQILGVVHFLKTEYFKRDVILVSKDINIRIKARALSIPAEDYFNDKVLEDTELLHSGVKELPEDFWENHSKDMESWQEEGKMFYKLTGPQCKDFIQNEFVCYDFDKPFHAIVRKMVAAVSEYLQNFNNDGKTLLATEGGFTLELGNATLRGYIDRIEQDAVGQVVIVDLKTGKYEPRVKDLPEHAQLACYQLALTEGALEDVPEGARNGGAKLIYVTNGTKGKLYKAMEQKPYDDTELQTIRERIENAAEGMAGNEFTAPIVIEEERGKPHTRYEVRIHTSPAVSAS